MTNLNFINKDIHCVKLKIIKVSKDIEVLTENKKSTKESELQLEALNNRLNHLHQIKSVLEAWEVMKKHLEHFPSDFYNGIPEELITMTSKIDKEDYPVIKKALEVKE